MTSSKSRIDNSSFTTIINIISFYRHFTAVPILKGSVRIHPIRYINKCAAVIKANENSGKNLTNYFKAR